MISLEKYKGSKTRFDCPNCNGKKEFTRYQEDGNYFADNVGICNRLNKCGYHYTPKQFFADNPEQKQKAKKKFLAKNKTSTARTAPILKPKPDFIGLDVLKSTLKDYEYNSFVEFLLNLFPDDTDSVNEAVRRYFIGTWQKGRTVYWQIDKSRKIRTGKLISYNSSTGKRDKTTKPSYVHAELKRSGKLSDNFQLEQCLFGEHLLSIETDKTVAIVEAEKTAVIASIICPDILWLAASGMSYLNVEKLEKVGDRNIILYPDANAFEGWSKIADKAKSIGLNVKVSTLVESNSSKSEKYEGSDLADYLIEQQRRKNRLRGRVFLTGLVPNEILDDEILFKDFDVIFSERAAILEIMENLSREESEKAAGQPESLERIIESVLSN